MSKDQLRTKTYGVRSKHPLKTNRNTLNNTSMVSSRSTSIFDKSNFLNRTDLDESNIAEKSNQNFNKCALFVA